MSARPNETTPIPLRWIDGIMIVTTILLLSFALIAQAMPQTGAATLDQALSLLEPGVEKLNASNEE